MVIIRYEWYEKGLGTIEMAGIFRDGQAFDYFKRTNEEQRGVSIHAFNVQNVSDTEAAEIIRKLKS